MAVVFLLLVVVVQTAFLLVARDVAASAVAAAARRAAREGAVPGHERDRLLTELATTVPGAAAIEAEVVRRGDDVVATAAFAWRPPGPDLVPVVVRVHAAVPAASPP